MKYKLPMPSDESLREASVVPNRRGGPELNIADANAKVSAAMLNTSVHKPTLAAPPCFYPYMHLSSHGFCDDENAQQARLHDAVHQLLSNGLAGR
jgi:hypothetical protein